ncbi:class I SAM-dependent methyltransferase [Streptomyces olivaceus]|uniref:class I SAM-dependent methyltransferase n=1 Tax=Streptomyces olivaceus TaxID=47716 RepID=UPI00381AF2F5
MPNKNHWGYSLPTLADIASDADLRDHLTSNIVEMLDGPGSPMTPSVAERLLKLASQDDTDYEREARALLVSEGLLNGGPRDLQKEIEFLFELTRPWFVGSSLLDFGCGDGSMARRFAASGLDVTLTDVLEPAGLGALALPFVRTNEDGSVPVPDGAFGNVVVFSVLHHCEDPERSMAEIMRLVRPGGRILIVESVFGVHSGDLCDTHHMRHAGFLELSEEHQLHHTMFFDHLVNRIVGSYSDDPAMKVNVPFNYDRPSGWNDSFARLGARMVETLHIEVQVGRAPLHHTLNVFDR